MRRIAHTRAIISQSGQFTVMTAIGAVIPGKYDTRHSLSYCVMSVLVRAKPSRPCLARSCSTPRRSWDQGSPDMMRVKARPSAPLRCHRHAREQWQASGCRDGFRAALTRRGARARGRARLLEHAGARSMRRTSAGATARPPCAPC